MVFGGWLKGIMTRIGFFSCRRLLETLLGRELELSQLTDIDLRTGAGELSALEIGAGGTLGALFERSPFALHSGYIDKVRICLRPTDGRGPHLLLQGVEVNLVLRPGASGAAGSAEETSGQSKPVGSTPDVDLDQPDSEPDHDEEDLWGIGEKASSLDVLLQTTTVELEALTIHFLFEIGAERRQVEILMHVPSACMYDDSFDGVSEERPAAYQKVVQFPGAMLQLFQGDDIARDATDKLQDYARCLVVVGAAQPCTVLAKFPLASQEPTLLEISVPALEVILTAEQLQLVQQCLRLLLAPPTPEGLSAATAPAASAAPASASFAADVGHLHVTLLYEANKQLREVWAHTLARTMGHDTPAVATSLSVGCPLCPEVADWVTTALGSHLRLVVTGLEVQQDAGSSDPTVFPVPDALDATCLSIGWSLEVSEHLIPIPGNPLGALAPRKLLYCEEALSDHHPFSLRCIVTPERAGVAGQWEARQDCAVAVAPVVVQLDADVVDRLSCFLSQATVGVPMDNAPREGVGRDVVKRTFTHHVSVQGLSLLVGLAPSRADDALLASPSLRAFCNERRGATDALRLGVYSTVLAIRSQFAAVTTLEGAPCPPPSEEEEVRWDWSAQTATVFLQTTDGAYRLLRTADGMVAGHVITRSGGRSQEATQRQPFVSRQSMGPVAQHMQAIREQAAVAVRVAIPCLVGQSLRCHFEWFRLLLAQFRGTDSKGVSTPSVSSFDVEVGAVDVVLGVAAALHTADGRRPSLGAVSGSFLFPSPPQPSPAPTPVPCVIPESLAALEGSELFFSACSHDESSFLDPRRSSAGPCDAPTPLLEGPVEHAPDDPATPASHDRLELRAAHLFLAAHSHPDGPFLQVAFHAEDYAILETEEDLPILRCVRPGPGGFRLYTNGADGLDILFLRPALNHRLSPTEGWMTRIVGFFTGEANPTEVPPQPQTSFSPSSCSSDVDIPGSPIQTAPPRRPFSIAVAAQDALIVYEPLHAPAQAALLLTQATFTTTITTHCPKSRFSISLGHAALLLHDAFLADVVTYDCGLRQAPRGVQAALAEMGFVQVLSLSGLVVDVETDAQQHRSITMGDAVVAVDACADSFALLKDVLQHIASGEDLRLLQSPTVSPAGDVAPPLPPHTAVDAAVVSALALAIVTDNPAFCGKSAEAAPRHQTGSSPKPDLPYPTPEGGGWASAPPKLIDCYVPTTDTMRIPAKPPDVVVEVLGLTPPLSPSVEVQTLEGISFSKSSSGDGTKAEVMDIVIDAGDDFIFALLDAEAGGPISQESPEWRATLHRPIRLIEDYLLSGPSAEAAPNAAPPASPKQAAPSSAVPSAAGTVWRVENVALTVKCFGGLDFSRSGPSLHPAAPFKEHVRHGAGRPPVPWGRGRPGEALPSSARDSQQAVQLCIRSLELSAAMFDDSSALACHVHFVAEEVECCDCFVRSTRNVMLGRWSDGGDMLTLLWDVVRPEEQQPQRVEHRIRLSVLPVLMNVEQDTAEFLLSFFGAAHCGEDQGDPPGDSSRPDRPPKEAATVPYIQHFSISPVDVTLSYKPKRINFATLCSGNYCEMLNLCSLQGSRISLPAAEVVGCRGLQQVADRLLDVWLPVISRTDYLMFLCGLQPIRALSKVGDSMAGLVLTPLSFYHRDGTLFRGIALALQDFATTVCLEAVDLTANVSVSTQSLLEKTASTFGPGGDGRACSRYARQPASPSEGVSQAYSALARSVKAAAQAVLTIPELAPRNGYVSAGLRTVPIVLLNPMIGLTEAVARMLFGVRNGLDPHHKVAMDRIYKPG